MRNVISVLPFASLIASLLSNYVTFNYVVAGNTLGYSLATDAFMLYFVFKLRFCIYTKLAVISLILLNLVCLLGTIINYSTYAKLYDTSIIGICLFSCLVIYLMKRK